MKKTLVVLLALMMVFAFATTAMAADQQYVPYNDISDQDVDIQTAIERLSVLGALKGYDAEGTKFAPSQLISREEFATIGVRIAGLEDQVSLYASMATAFKDVEEGRWSEGYINCANANGIMVGRGNGIFDPKANVTMQEVTTVLLRAVGYDDRLPGAWPSDFNTKAVAVGLTEYVDYVGPKAATRAEVASLTNETLDLWKVQYVENPTAAGIGQILGTTVIGEDGDKVALVDKDNYMYIKNPTNVDKDEKYGVSLLEQTFHADLITGVIFADDKDNMSETQAWGFADFDKGELEAYTISYDKGKDKYVPDEDFEFASVYGVSRGQDITDLGWQTANVTINDDDEIIYIDLTSNITRTADVTAAQEKAISNAKNLLGDKLEEGNYGEIWYNKDGKVYAAKDFFKFEKAEFGIVNKVDKDGVYFKNPPKVSNLDLDEDIAFYLVGEGFIKADDLKEGDVIYTTDKLSGADYFALVIRPVSASFDKPTNSSIQIGDEKYGVAANSYVSFDKGESFQVYKYADISSYLRQFSNKVAFVPAYAFANFAYISDEVEHAGAGILDHYRMTGASDTLKGDGTGTKTITGMYVRIPGQKDLELIEFEENVKFVAGDAVESAYPVEGAYIEYTVNTDGEFVVVNKGDGDKAAGFVAMHQWDKDCAGKACDKGTTRGEWTKNNDKLSIDVTGGFSDVYSFASNAVIYLVESSEDKGAQVYDQGSAEALTLDEFKKLGDFNADEICVFDAAGGEIRTLYIRNIDAEGENGYGIGMYQYSDFFTGVGGKASTVIIGGKEIEVKRSESSTIQAALDGAVTSKDDAAIVAYHTIDGQIDNIFIFDDATTTDAANTTIAKFLADSDFGKYATKLTDPKGLDYQVGCGTIKSYEDHILTLDNSGDTTVMPTTEDTAELTFDSRGSDFQGGFDFNKVDDKVYGEISKPINLDERLKAAAEDTRHVLVVYQGSTDNIVNIIIFADAINHTDSN